MAFDLQDLLNGRLTCSPTIHSLQPLARAVRANVPHGETALREDVLSLILRHIAALVKDQPVVLHAAFVGS